MLVEGATKAGREELEEALRRPIPRPREESAAVARDSSGFLAAMQAGAS